MLFVAVSFIEFGIYTVDVDYLKYLHDFDKNVYYAPNYETKPFLGIAIVSGSKKYIIPFTSAKQKHAEMKFSSLSHFLITEPINSGNLSPKGIYKKDSNGNTLHILSLLDLRKMIPVVDGVYHKTIFSQISDKKYRTLLIKELRFCRNISHDILTNVETIYTLQSHGVVYKDYTNLKVLEKASLRYKKGH